MLDFEYTFTQGEHVIEVLGGENCCDGATTWEFSYAGDTWEQVTQESLEALG